MSPGSAVAMAMVEGGVGTLLRYVSAAGGGGGGGGQKMVQELGLWFLEWEGR